jgi:hypothetical protein
LKCKTWLVENVSTNEYRMFSEKVWRKSDFRSKWCTWKLKGNSVTCDRERNIPKERKLLFGKVSANVLRIEGATWTA